MSVVVVVVLLLDIVVLVVVQARNGGEEIKLEGRLRRSVSQRSLHSFSRWGAENHFNPMVPESVPNMQSLGLGIPRE